MNKLSRLENHFAETNGQGGKKAYKSLIEGIFKLWIQAAKTQMKFREFY